MVKNVKLDAIDLRILAQIQANARITNVLLADTVGLSPSPCLQRLKRLEKAGLIRRYHGEVDLVKLAGVTFVFTEITLGGHRKEDFLKFERAIAQEPTVLECHCVSGGFDYLVKFAVRHIGHYQEIFDALLAAEIGIVKYFSYIVLKTTLEPRAPDLSLYLQAST